MEIGGGVVVKRLLFGALWRIYQLALMGCGLVIFFRVFGNLNERQFPLLWIAAMFVFAFIFTRTISVLTGRLLSRPSRSNLPDKTDCDPDGFGGSGAAGSQDTLEVSEIPLREKPRKLFRSPP